MAANTLKNSLLLTDSDVETFLEGEENQNTKEKPKVMCSVALVKAFLTAENKNLQLEDLSQADFSHVPERFPLSVRTNSITDREFCILKIWHIVCSVVIQCMFSS